MKHAMTGRRPQTTKHLATASRPSWRHLVVLGLVTLLLVLLFVRLTALDEMEPQNVAVRSTQSPMATIAETKAEPVEPLPMAAEVEAPGHAFIAKLNLKPRLLNGRVKGYVVRPDDPSILKGTPLQPGDILLEVDGLELDAARAAFLAQNVGDYQDVFVRFERGNAEREGMLPLGTR